MSALTAGARFSLSGARDSLARLTRENIETMTMASSFFVPFLCSVE